MRPKSPEEMDDRGAYLPSQEEIEIATAKIQSGWSKREKRSRCSYPNPRVNYKPATVSLRRSYKAIDDVN